MASTDKILPVHTESINSSYQLVHRALTEVGSTVVGKTVELTLVVVFPLTEINFHSNTDDLSTFILLSYHQNVYMSSCEL